MKIAFYKAKYGGFIDHLIMYWTSLCAWRWGAFSHVELIFSDGEAFSSSQRDGGVRYKRIKFDPKKWTIFDILITQKEEAILQAKCDMLVDLEYDWIGIFFHQFLPLNIHDIHRWWCSEIVAHVLNIDPERINPNELYWISNE